MTGLELITDKIISQARAQADAIIAQANAQADGIKAEYAEEMQKQKSELMQKKADALSLQTERFEAVKNAKRHDMLLQTQREVAQNIIEEAKKKILSLSDSEYFAFLAELYKNTANGSKGEILLTAEDKKRMPEGFVESLNGNLTISDENAPSAGFIIRSGRIEQNCTIEAIIRDRQNELYDIACGKE